MVRQHTGQTLMLLQARALRPFVAPGELLPTRFGRSPMMTRSRNASTAGRAFSMIPQLVCCSNSGKGFSKCTGRVIAFGLALSVAGCVARPTGYVDANTLLHAPYGFSVTPMGGDEYSILVRANSVTPTERVAEIALLRAAHLTIEKGGNRFSIIHSESLTYHYQRLNSVPIGGVFIPVSTSPSADKLAALVIHVSLPGATPVAPDAIDAERVVADLSSKLKP
jgi:hypothetical protein